MGNYRFQFRFDFFRSPRRYRGVNSGDGNNQKKKGAADTIWENYLETSDLDPEIYLVVNKKMATLIELDQGYSTSDLYDLLEIAEISSDLEKASHKDAEQESRNNKR